MHQFPESKEELIDVNDLDHDFAKIILKSKNNTIENIHDANHVKKVPTSFTTTRINAYLYGTLLTPAKMNGKSESLSYGWMLGDIISQRHPYSKKKSLLPKENKNGENIHNNNQLVHQHQGVRVIIDNNWEHDKNGSSSREAVPSCSYHVRFVSNFPTLGIEEKIINVTTSVLNQLITPLLNGCNLCLLTEKLPIEGVINDGKVHDSNNNNNTSSRIKKWVPFYCTFWLESNLRFLQWKSMDGKNNTYGKIPISNLHSVINMMDRISPPSVTECCNNKEFLLINDHGSIDASNVLKLRIWSPTKELVDLTIGFSNPTNRDIWWKGLNYCNNVLRYIFV